MNRYIKKLAILVTISVLALFTTAVMASDWPWPPAQHFIRGQYAFTGGSSCLNAPAGFQADHSTPIAGDQGVFTTNSASWVGVFTFKPNGTGTMTGKHLAVIVPSSVINPAFSPFTGTANVTWVFTYTVSRAGDITFTFVPNTYTIEWISGTFKGQTQYFDVEPAQGRFMSQDGNILNVTSVSLLTQLDANFNPTSNQLSCNISFVLIRQ